MQGNICLVDIDEGRFPVLLFRKNKHGIFGLRIKKYENKDESNTVYIGKPNGLKMMSAVVVIDKLYNVRLKDIVKNMAVIDKDKFKEITNAYDKFHENDKLLHEEMHKIKKKIALAQINNTDYSDLQKRLDYILEKLNYVNKSERYKKPYKNFREVPTNRYIKIYRGGRGG